jgi:hypothetical protein
MTRSTNYLRKSVAHSGKTSCGNTSQHSTKPDPGLSNVTCRRKASADCSQTWSLSSTTIRILAGFATGPHAGKISSRSSTRLLTRLRSTSTAYVWVCSPFPNTLLLPNTNDPSDCMNGTSETEADKAKWNPHDKRRDWSEGCRIPHEEPTYFYSVMPHREKREGLFT